MEPTTLSALRKIFGDRLLDDRETRLCYSFDATGMKFLPDAVAFPLSTEEVRLAVLLANEKGFPVVPRGAGSG